MLKCRYKYCKHGNIVDKELAIKEGNAYYCKDCYEEKQDKIRISEIIKEILPTEMKQNINVCVYDWVHKKQFDAKYIIYTLEYIKNKNCNINSVYGVIYYLNNNTIKIQYDSDIINKKCNTILQKKFDQDNEEVVFKYNSNTGRDWCKIL